MTAEGAAPSRLDAIPSDVIELATMRTSTRGFLTPEQTVDRLEEIHATATSVLRATLARFASGGPPPMTEERAEFCYPELRVDWLPSSGSIPRNRRSWAKLQEPGAYATTVTHPSAFRSYLIGQLTPLVSEYSAALSVGSSSGCRMYATREITTRPVDRL
jgi:AMP nucleosidase